MDNKNSQNYASNKGEKEKLKEKSRKNKGKTRKGEETSNESKK